MHILIKDDHTIGQLKADFHKQFPKLKLEFYSKPHHELEGSGKEHMIPDDKLIGDIRTIHNTADFHFTPDFKVSELEGLFQKSFGLNIQVFRKNGDIWLQTTKTDDWTLAKQNAEAFV